MLTLQYSQSPRNNLLFWWVSFSGAGHLMYQDNLGLKVKRVSISFLALLLTRYGIWANTACFFVFIFSVENQPFKKSFQSLKEYLWQDFIPNIPPICIHCILVFLLHCWLYDSNFGIDVHDVTVALKWRVGYLPQYLAILSHYCNSTAAWGNSYYRWRSRVSWWGS